MLAGDKPGFGGSRQGATSKTDASPASNAGLAEPAGERAGSRPADSRETEGNSCGDEETNIIGEASGTETAASGGQCSNCTRPSAFTAVDGAGAEQGLRGRG